ncbi:MAG: acyl-CoA thioesterase [Myxococcales bacterium]|nr:acyl-CoA thioesterase [Myxococcales bacterium]
MKGFAVVVRFAMHWGEMDALGHANNARYFTWFESARIAYFERVALASRAPSRTGPILASARCDFLRPVVFPCELLVGARVSAMRTTSFTMRYAVASAAEPDVCCARGSGVVVLYDYRARTKVPISDVLRARIDVLEHPDRSGASARRTRA